MNFLKRFLNKTKVKSIRFIQAMGNFNLGEDYLDTVNLNSYKDSLYLFIGVSMIRETVSSIPLEVYKIINKDGEVEEIQDDELVELLERPNYKQTKKEFWKLAVAYYLLAGETFWYLSRKTPDAFPDQVANLRPDHVEILISEDKKDIIAYEFFQADGTTIKLRPEDVLHIKNVDPTNPARGVGVVRPASQRIITEREASKYQADTFKTRGRPDIAIFTSVEDLTEEAAQDARDKFQKVYGSNGTNAGVFGADVKDIKMLNVNPKEMDFINSQNFLRDDILAALRIPKAMITSDDVNLANSKTARTNYLKEACLPVLDAFLDVINNKFIAYTDDKFVTYESPVQEDRELLLKESTELKRAGIITVNESRSLMNYPDIDGGDTLSESTGYFQLALKKLHLKKLAKRCIKSRSILSKKFVAIEAVQKMVADEVKLNEVTRARNSVFNTKELKEKYVKSVNKNIDNKATLFKDAIDVYNTGLLQRILKTQADLGLNPDNIFAVGMEIVEAKRIFVPLMKSIFEKSAKDTMEMIANGFANKAAENFFTAEEMLRDLEQRAEFFIGSMLDTDFKQLKKIIMDGMKAGKGVDEIGRLMRDYFDDMSVARAKTIARTETGRLISSATNEAYKQSEFVTGKEWLTAKDADVRPADNPALAGSLNDHVQNEGKIVDKGGIFPNGEEYPGQYTINCRCVLAPAI